jgi:hypothetical protein
MNTRNTTGTDSEKALLRELAEQVAAIAREPRMAAIKQRWRDVNALRKPDRAPVWCRPVGCWKEILPDTALSCADPWHRGLEYGFRQTLYKYELDDDTPVEEDFPVSARFTVDPPNRWGLDIHKTPPDVDGGAWAYDPPLKTEADFAALVVPRFTLDKEQTERELQRIDDLFGDILPPRLTVGAPGTATLGNAAAELRGLEQMMLDMAIAPDLMHRLMACLRDAVLSAIDYVESLGTVTPNNNGPMTCSDPVGPPPEQDRYTSRNCWCMANSQEFDQVSPAMWEEFCLEYQKPILARYGLVGYGCCENLTHKIDGVLSIPNLRIFTCSAWTDLSRVMEAVGRDYCIMWRQKASDVVFPDDETTIRKDLQDGARRLQGFHYQIVLRELQTLAGHPDRLQVWTRLAKEAAEHHA